jgi:small subunit ribosomal protein S16
MLTIRMQRTGRKGYASFRIVVQDSRFSPSSGRVVSKIGHYNPHTKETVIDKEKATEYLDNGAQPSPRVVHLFKTEKIKLPEWVTESNNTKKRSIRNPEKLRKNQSKPEATEQAAPEISEEISTEKSIDTQTDEVQSEEVTKEVTEEAAVVDKKSTEA